MPGQIAKEGGITEFARHMQLIRTNIATDASAEIRSTPIFTSDVRKYTSELADGQNDKVFTQYGLLGGISKNAANDDLVNHDDPRLFYNVASPNSVFICGSQGSGKSHTLSCLLENCLMESAANVLPRPLTGIVFHYDTFNSDTGGAPSEAAFLSSHLGIEVRVLCAPTNRVKIEEVYRCLPNVVVEEFRIHERQLNTKRMLDLMAMGSVAGDAWPLYMHTVTRILRDMRLAQQISRTEGFDYGDFKHRLEDEGLFGSQLGPLQQRLDALESFMYPEHVIKSKLQPAQSKKKKSQYISGAKTADKTWAPEPGRLTIVDLSCPCITDMTACALFNICLSLFLEQDSEVGRIVALDEAHKYMKDSAECQILTESLLSAIRLQRHLAARVFISTQEPTISPKLMDLCSVTIVHRFTSPEWLNALQSHLAGASKLAGSIERSSASVPSTARRPDAPLADIFAQIVRLRTGEALLFAPSAAIGMRMEAVKVMKPTEAGRLFADDSTSSTESHESESELVSKWMQPVAASLNGKRAMPPKKLRPVEALCLAYGVLKIHIRQRVTADGGKSIFAE